MKVNASLLQDENEKALQAEDIKIKVTHKEEPDTDDEAIDENDDRDEDGDESKKHSKIKMLLLLAAMVGGFGLFVWNMTGLVNNMRLDNQGHAVNVVYEMEDLDDFMGGSAVTDNHVDSHEDTESEVSTDAARDDPGDDANVPKVTISAADGTDDVEELRQIAKNALNEAALVRQELKNAEDMLDSSLAREADLQNRIEELESN